MDEICQVYNLDPGVVKNYVQFGEVFNLLHAGASYLRVHQKGFGAVGVSKKYGKRSLMRYPIFWGLHKIGALPNPDPTDTAEWDKAHPKQEDIVIDTEMEAKRGDLRRQAQEWAGLTVDPSVSLDLLILSEITHTFTQVRISNFNTLTRRNYSSSSAAGPSKRVSI
jgi:alpha-1,3-glucan synthase